MSDTPSTASPSSLPLPSYPLVSSLLVPAVAWQVTGVANNSGCGCPLLSKAKPHDKLPSSVCFASSPRRSPPRPVVTFCCILYMQIPANQLARRSLRCPLWLKWIDCGLKSTAASLPRAQGSMGRDRGNGEEKINLEVMVFPPTFPFHFFLHCQLLSAGIKHSGI